MGDDAIEGKFTGGFVEIALRRGEIRDRVEAAVEFGEHGGAFGDVVGIGVGGAVAGGHQRGDAGAGAEIEERFAGAGRDEIQEQVCVGDHCRIHEVVGRTAVAAFDGGWAVGDDVEIAQRVQHHGSGQQVGVDGAGHGQSQGGEKFQRQSTRGVAVDGFVFEEQADEEIERVGVLRQGARRRAVIGGELELRDFLEVQALADGWLGEAGGDEGGTQRGEIGVGAESQGVGIRGGVRHVRHSNGGL